MKPCILPWINFGTNTFGRPRVCGYSETKLPIKLKDSTITEQWNSEYFRQIRKDFLDNKWPDNCRRCEYVEKLGGISKKQLAIESSDGKYDHLIDLTNSDGSVPYYPLRLDIRVGTICNLKCIHCGTGASSKWKEDKELIDKYPNTENYNIDNKWIEQDDYIWDSIKENIGEVRRLNFLGGEPFANKKHNIFIKEVSNSESAKKIELFYVTNGTLLTEELIDRLIKFKRLTINISVDAIDKPIEYFRYPIVWNDLKNKLFMLNEYSKNFSNIWVGIQWTCSNISMYYLIETYELIKKEFPNLFFTFANHVEWPIHMSAQVLPNEIKSLIGKKIKDHDWGTDYETVQFYVNHMMEKDLWSEHGNTFMNYLDDLDRARNVSWKTSFEEMNLEKYDDRK
jgi:MoaA/NifB/PqqE/SkfB family radical SAM enzyme